MSGPALTFPLYNLTNLSYPVGVKKHDCALCATPASIAPYTDFMAGITDHNSILLVSPATQKFEFDLDSPVRRLKIYASISLSSGGHTIGYLLSFPGVRFPRRYSWRSCNFFRASNVAQNAYLSPASFLGNWLLITCFS